MKSKSIVLLFGLLSMITILAISGCGTSATGGGSSLSGTTMVLGPNMGSVEGTVYDRYIVDENTFSFIATGDAIVTITKTGTTDSYSTKCSASGYYLLLGVPSGEVNITVTKEGFESVTVVATMDIVNIPMATSTFSSYPAGTSRVFGNVTTVTGTNDFRASAYSAVGAAFVSRFYDTISHTYEVTGVPFGKEVYVFGTYTPSTDSTQKIINIKKLDNVINGSNINYDFNMDATKCMTVEGRLINIPSGYSESNGYASSRYCRGYSVFSAHILSPNIYGNVFTAEGLPIPFSGDNVRYQCSVSDGAEHTLDRFVYCNSAGLYDYDMNISPINFGTLSPNNGANLSSSPIFDWNAVADASYYFVSVMDGGTDVWTGYTNNTSIEMPAKIFNSLAGSTTYSWSVAYYTFVNFTGIHDLPLALGKNSYDGTTYYTKRSYIGRSFNKL
jgi:hypothetical protein